MRGVMVQSQRYFAMALLILTVAAGSLFAQNKTQRLHVPDDRGTVRANGYIGGEAHDLYAINVPAGKKMVVRVISKANQADFYVTDSTEPQSEPIHFGEMNEKLRTWTGTVPVAHDYYIIINSNPPGRYTLVVSVN